MKKIFSLLILTLSFSANSQSNLEDPLKERSYLFSVIIDVTHLQYNDDYKYVINGGFNKNEQTKEYNYFEGRKLYKINYKYDSDENNMKNGRVRTPIDTIILSLSYSQLDTIYSLTANLFCFNDQNIRTGSEYEELYDSFYDGPIAKVVFDLGDLGERYALFVKDADTVLNPNKQYLQLINYLKRF